MSLKKRTVVAVWLSALLSFGIVASGAPMGTAFTYQGRLQDAGSPANGLYDLRFGLYGVPTGGTQVGTTVCADNVTVTEGLFTLIVDFGAQFNGQERFLEIEVRTDTGLDCTNATGFTTLTPRQALTAVPNALFATSADRLDGLDSIAFLQSIPVPLTLSGTSTTHIIRGENASTTNGASGVFGLATDATGFTYGGNFQSASTHGTGVYGAASASTGFNSGVVGESCSTDGTGVYGVAFAGTGMTYGVLGQSLSTSGRAVFGQATASSGTTYGVYGQSNSSSGRAVYGDAAASSGITYGGRFESSSTSGRGVYGVATATTGNTYGVHGCSSGDNGIGVVGQAISTSGTTYGVYGVSDSPAGYDFYAAGVGLNYGAASSRRWKRNIEPIGQPLDKLGRLRGVYFNWNAEHGSRHDVGMIAEEVGAVLPEIVNYEENCVDAIGMDYSKMTPLLVQAVNALRAEKDAQLAEQQKQMVEQQNQITEQKKKINELIARLERMEKAMSQTGYARNGTD